MRVIAGSARSLNLKTIKSLGTRPTTDRIKETLFNILQNDIERCVFLDLFSGSGAIGIEALSRGAKSAYFVENNKEALKCIDENLTHTKLKDNATVLGYDVLMAIDRLEAENITFDIIFMDPPYEKEFEKKVLIRLKASNVADNNTLIIIEADKRTDFDYLDELGYEIVKEKVYKTNKHIFARKK